MAAMAIVGDIFMMLCNNMETPFRKTVQTDLTWKLPEHASGTIFRYID